MGKFATNNMKKLYLAILNNVTRMIVLEYRSKRLYILFKGGYGCNKTVYNELESKNENIFTNVR